jgi:hypothetical protein
MEAEDGAMALLHMVFQLKRGERSIEQQMMTTAKSVNPETQSIRDRRTNDTPAQQQAWGMTCEYMQRLPKYVGIGFVFLTYSVGYSPFWMRIRILNIQIRAFPQVTCSVSTIKHSITYFYKNDYFQIFLYWRT